MAIISRFIGTIAIAVALITAPTAAFAGVFVGVGVGVDAGISVAIAPPPLPVYAQPAVLVPDQIWMPGYWAYGAFGYYWVPGTWVAAPQVGYLWTPGYWGYVGSSYVWHGGYWGPHIGFYGGVNYGFGYTGNGYVGGGWNGGHFQYNTAVTNVNRTVITNVYVNRTVINNVSYDESNVSRVSYNGGPGGVDARPTPEERYAQSEPHLAPTALQQQHIQSAAHNRNYLASVNAGHPENAAMAVPLNRENRPEYRAPAYRAPAYRAPAAPHAAPHPAPAHPDEHRDR